MIRTYSSKIIVIISLIPWLLSSLFTLHTFADACDIIYTLHNVIAIWYIYQMKISLKINE